MRHSLPKVTALGGGHGLYASLEALRQVTDDLTAVVTVADNGGSSGRLRRELGGLPPGDLRMALAALCGSDSFGRRWASVLQSRFCSSGPLNGHAIGNLLIEGVWQQLDAVSGLALVAGLLNARGRVLPMSNVPLSIQAEVIGLDPDDPQRVTIVEGQHEVATTTGSVCSVKLVPRRPPACPQAVEAITESDYVVLGPGSWFTSVMPHLLLPESAEALCSTSAQKVLTLNLVSDDETQGFSPARHLEILIEHAPDLRFDAIIVDESFASGDVELVDYAQRLGARLVVADIRLHNGSSRHDPLRLASVYRDVFEING